MEKVKSFTKKNIIVFVLIFLCLGFGLGNKSFLSAQNLVNLTTQMAINAMLSAGLTYVIILGGIDISVGSVAALAGVCGALVARENPNASIFVASLIWIGAALVVGALCGAFNGLMIAYFKVVPMIATLAMLNMAVACASCCPAVLPYPASRATIPSWALPGCCKPRISPPAGSPSSPSL